MESSFDTLVLEPCDIKDGKLRKIYYEVPFEEYEHKYIAKMKEYITEKSLTFPEWVDDATLLKFAEATRGKKIKKSIKRL